LKFSILRKLNSSKQDIFSISRRLIDPQRRIQDAAIRCDELLQRLENGVGRYLRDQRVQIELFLKRLGSPLQRLALDRESLQGLTAQLRSGVRNTLMRKRERLQKDMAVLDSLSPLKVLDRGYSMVMIGDRVITKTADLAIAQTISIRLSEGHVQAEVTKIEKD
jgi:exodeoxyribonuclease VII large subunit